jgi:hypothetical protein
MFVYHHKNHSASFNTFGMLQEYALTPLLVLLGLFGAMIIYLLANHVQLLWYGTIGGICLALLSNFFGKINARASYLEIGFSEEFFYLKSAYDIAYNQNLKYYPLAYANATMERNTIYINYIEQTVKIRREDWEKWHEIWAVFNGQLSVSNVS